MRLIFAQLELEMMPEQILFQLTCQMQQLRRYGAGRIIQDMVMPPVTRLVQTYIKALRADLPGRQLQGFQARTRDVAQKNQCEMQSIGAHLTPAA